MKCITALFLLSSCIEDSVALFNNKCKAKVCTRSNCYDKRDDPDFKLDCNDDEIDWRSVKCCKWLYSEAPTPTPPFEFLDCVCSPRTFSFTVSQFVSSSSGADLNLFNLCNNNPLGDMPGIQTTNLASTPFGSGQSCYVETATGFSFNDGNLQTAKSLTTQTVTWSEDSREKKTKFSFEVEKEYKLGKGFTFDVPSKYESISAQLDPTETLPDQKKNKIPLGAYLLLEGDGIDTNDQPFKFKIGLYWEYTGECGEKPFADAVTFFGLGSIISISTPVDQAPLDQFCAATGADLPLGISAAKSAVEEAPALENPNSSLDMTAGVAWGIVTATMMLFIMG